MLSEKPRVGLSETRKVTKSTMEKKRRARINSSLTELKNILAGMVTNKGERFEKMEKADILEMTVSCVRQLQRQSQTGDQMSPVPSDEEYKSGIDTCVSEVIKMLTSNDLGNTDPEIKTKLIDHLANKLCTPIYPNPAQSESPGSMQTHDVLNSTVDRFGKNRLGVLKKPSEDLGISPHVQQYNPNSEISANEPSLVSSPNVVGASLVSSPNVVGASPQPIYQVTTVPFSNFSPSDNTVKSSMDSNQLTTSHSNISTVPLTILVPANFCSTQLGTTFCSTQLGTTCMIPVAWTGASSNYPQQQTNDYSTIGAPLSSYVSNISPQQLLNLSPPFGSQITPIQTYTIPENVPDSEMDTAATLQTITSDQIESSVVKDNNSKGNETRNSHEMVGVKFYKPKSSVIRPTPLFKERCNRSDTVSSIVFDGNQTRDTAMRTDRASAEEFREKVQTFQSNTTTTTTTDHTGSIRSNVIQAHNPNNRSDETGGRDNDNNPHVDSSVWRPW
ncbi:HES1B-like protein [Mya arenaria]|uniref:HES1B-like protein n=1 Tax=Mya arenaria TaxID=6604 RepID=A0ABY7F0J6_MYAAR|nr:uncharacterized protein LOC128245440 [Mya arenaria]WAR14421.1 HES1B-like protein [Mya arenaria]